MLDSLTSDILKQAVHAAQSGQIEQARNLAEGALSEGGDIVALNAFLGMLRAREGDHAGAIDHLQTANQGRPSDVTIACNLISALIDSGDLVSALDVATHDLSLSDPSLRVARYRGFLAQSLERFDEAAKAYEYIVEREPQDFESWNNLGNARQPLQDFSGSVRALERAVQLEPAAAPARLNLAAALIAADRADDAEAVLKTAAQDFPEDSHPRHELYVLYKKQRRQDEAFAILEEAVLLDPGSANLQLKLAIEYGLLIRLEDAERAYLQALSADPQLDDAYLGLAIQYEHSNREDEFAPLISRAEANGLEESTLGFLRALEYRRAGQFAEGLASLSKVPASVEPERAAHIRATLLDRLGRADEAFAAFEETALLHQANPSEPLPRASALRDELREEIELLTPAWVSGWSSDQPICDRPDPVFLIGFPRSGTTLLDTILMGHPAVMVMEEKPPLNHVDEAIGGLAAIPAMDESAIVKARRQYFEEVNAIEPFDNSRLLIDKSPLFLQKVPLIQRLFPNARFILALRHPCDVLLSCFMSNFRLNAAMANFLRLEDAAAFYDLTFRHWECACELFPVNMHRIKYEDLVENVEAEVRPLFDFLDLDWHDDVLDHRRTAKSRGLITTASYSQVTEPIYKRASGRWTRYRANLEPILPILEPWVERFGYKL